MVNLMLHTKALLGYKIGIILKPPHLLKKLVFLEVCSTRLWCSQYWRPRQVTSYVHFTSFWSSVLPRTYWLHFVVFLVWFYFPTQTMIYYINDKKKKREDRRAHGLNHRRLFLPLSCFWLASLL